MADSSRPARKGDVVVVTQKVVSKAEGMLVPVDPDDPALIVVPTGKVGAGTKAFLASLAKHRNWDRAMDPPPV